jgi:hypothetical protein
LVFSGRGWEGSAHDNKLNFIHAVSDGCELADAASHLQEGVVIVLASPHGSWLVTCVALRYALSGSSWAVGAGFGLRAGLRLCHDGYYGDAGDGSGGFSQQNGQEFGYFVRCQRGYYFGV